MFIAPYYKKALLIERAAGATYTKKGYLLKPKKDCLRVHFTIFGDLSQFDFACQKSKKPIKNAIPIQIGTEIVYASLEECSDRLHISVKKLLKCSKNGTLTNLFTRQEKYFLLLPKIIETYALIIKNYNSSSHDKLLKSIKEPQFTTKRRFLMKAIGLFYQDLDKKTIPPFIMNVPNQTRVKNPSRVTKILASSTSNDPCFLVDISNKTIISKGHYGVVSIVACISSGIFLALKEPTEDERLESRAWSDIREEIINYNKLKELGLKNNILIPYFYSTNPFFTLNSLCNNKDLLYTINNIKKIEKRLLSLAKPISALIETLSNWHENLIAHGDIKLENILVHQNKKGLYKLYFCDLGGLYKGRHLNQRFPIGIHTKSYSPPGRKGDYLSLKSHLARDVYQLGATITLIFSNELPYINAYNFNDHPDFMLTFPESLLFKRCSRIATKLLGFMCHPEEQKRPTMQQVQKIISLPYFTWEKED